MYRYDKYSICVNSKKQNQCLLNYLYKKFLLAGLPPVFNRLLINIYMIQFVNVRWNGRYSSVFSMTNGVRQGAVLSGFAYCFYMNGLFEILRKNRSGCWVNGTFFGIIGYSDDSLLLAPSLESLQSMLLLCQNYAEEHNLKFSTDKNPKKSKTKCLAFLKKNRELGPLLMCGNPLPWDESGKHLGNYIENKSRGMKMDISVKRAQFISKNNEILQEFNFSHPKTKISINSIYNSHFTGSCLWDLFSAEAVSIYSTWNTAMKLMLNLPIQTHRKLIEPLSQTPHIRSVLMRRFLNFLEQVEKSRL